MVRALLLTTAIMLVSPPPAAGKPGDVARARELGQKAAKAFRAKRFEAALQRFREANRLVPHPNLDVNIGRCYEALGQPEQALVHCKIALNAPGVPASTRRAAQKCVDRVTAALARPVLQITSTPSGATVLIDGRSVGRTPWRGTSEPGQRQIELEQEGLRRESRTINAERGQRYELLIVLSASSVGGILKVASVPPGAKVLLDGDVVGTTPMPDFPVDARSYVLELALEGHQRHISRVTVADGQTLERSVSLVPTVLDAQPLPRWPGWALVGLGVVAVGVGGVLGYQALETNRDADALARTSNDPEDGADFDALDEEWRSQAALADVLYIGGGVALAGGITWLLWPADD